MKIKNIGKNKTELRTDVMIIFFSYQTPVCAQIDGKFYRTKEKHSVTTLRHINEWLKGVKAESKNQSFFDKLIA